MGCFVLLLLTHCSNTNQQPSFGIGLQNTKDRLALLYGNSANVSLIQQDNNAIALTVTLPMR